MRTPLALPVVGAWLFALHVTKSQMSTTPFRPCIPSLPFPVDRSFLFSVLRTSIRSASLFDCAPLSSSFVCCHLTDPFRRAVAIPSFRLIFFFVRAPLCRLLFALKFKHTNSEMGISQFVSRLRRPVTPPSDHAARIFLISVQIADNPLVSPVPSDGYFCRASSLISAGTMNFFLLVQLSFESLHRLDHTQSGSPPSPLRTRDLAPLSRKAQVYLNLLSRYLPIRLTGADFQLRFSKDHT